MIEGRAVEETIRVGKTGLERAEGGDDGAHERLVT
jgi:hypothetical protein